MFLDKHKKRTENKREKKIGREKGTTTIETCVFYLFFVRQRSFLCRISSSTFLCACVCVCAHFPRTDLKYVNMTIHKFTLKAAAPVQTGSGIFHIKLKLLVVQSR